MAWQIIFIIFNYISLCNCARALALPFGDGGVALACNSTVTSASASLCTRVARVWPVAFNWLVILSFIFV